MSDFAMMEQGQTFTIVYHDVLRLLDGDVVASLLLNRFLTLLEVYKKSGQVQDGDWFFQCVDAVEKDLGLSYPKQKSAITRLCEKNYIETSVMGQPPRRYIRINTEVFLADLSRFRDIEAEGEDSQAIKKAFYDRLNSAWTSKDFKEALDKIPLDIGEFMYAWTHGYSWWMGQHHRNENPLWRWDPKSFGILKTHWNNTYRKIRKFDYLRLETFFKNAPSREDISIVKFLTFDRVTADRVFPMTLRDHQKREDSIFK
jgi:hypothetical protein